MKKIILVQPPVEDFYDTEVRLQPIGLAYLKSAMKVEHPEIECLVMDFHTGRGRQTIKIPKELSYLKDYYPIKDESPFCSFFNYFRFGESLEKMTQEILDKNPDLVGISSLFSPYYREVLTLVSALKSAKPDLIIVLGGSHVSACPELMLAHEGVDFIITGEGEIPLVQLVSCLKSSGDYRTIPQLGYKAGQKLHINPAGENLDLQRFPIPDFSDLNPDLYRYEGNKICFLVTSRSCPHRCSFCSVHTTFGTSYRRRSVQSVLDEIDARILEGYQAIDFEDDNLSFYQTEFREILNAIISRYGERKIRLMAMNGISYISLNQELLELMYRAGFTNLNLALVSSDKAVRETTKRPHTLEKFETVLDTSVKIGLSVIAYQILGLPSESLASMIQTLAYLGSKPVNIGVSTFYLTPSSPIAKNFPPRSEKDIFLARSSAMAITSDEISRSSLYTLFVTARILNFLKSLPIQNSISLESLLESWNSEQSRQNLGIELLRILHQEHKLILASKNGSRHVQPGFSFPVYEQVLNQIVSVPTQAGGSIFLHH